MLIRIKKAQSITEYAILFAIVVAAAAGVQNYVRRGLSARVHDAIGYYAAETNQLGDTLQWEPATGQRTITEQTSARTFIEDYDGDTSHTFADHDDVGSMIQGGEGPFYYVETGEVTFDGQETK